MRRRSGQTLVELALLLALIAVVAIPAVAFLGARVSTTASSVAGALSAPTPTPTPGPTPGLPVFIATGQAASGTGIGGSVPYTATTSAAPIAGDLLIAYFGSRTSGAPSWPAGFTQIAAVTGPDTLPGDSYLAYKVATGSEGTSFTATHPNANTTMFSVMIYRSAGATSWVPDGAAALGPSGPGVSAVSPNVTPGAGARVIFGGVTLNPNYGPSLPGYNVRSTYNTGDGRMTFVAVDQLVQGSSATYGGTWSPAGGETYWETILAAFQPV